MSQTCKILFPLLLLALFPAALSGQEPLFVDVSAEVGLSVTRLGDERAIGQAWGDFDNDGWLDLYLTDPAGPNRLYRNVQGKRFEPVTQPAVALSDSFSGGAIFIDYDNDGWQDLYVVSWGENHLLHNQAGTFVEVTAEAGVGGGELNSQTASWGDYDQDGYLDLYVANWACYPRCGRPSTGEVDRFYRNLGDGTFEDVTHLLSGKVSGSGFVASFTDFDSDGDLDIYLVNDEFIHPVGNALWRNDGPGCDGWCFTEVSAEAGADTRVMGMGLATADYDNDGDLDFYFSNAGPMTLLQNQGDSTFANLAPSAGVDTPTSIGWGAVFFDADNDGWQDLYLAVSEAASREGSARNRFFRNLGDGTFENMSVESGADDGGATLGVATADYDRDGRVDLIVGNIDTGYVLYRNQTPTTAGWLSIQLEGSGPINRNAVGSRVWVTTPDGQTQMQEVIAGASLGAGNDLALHFGLGIHQTVAQLDILWPDGTRQTFQSIDGQRHIVVPYPLDQKTQSQQQQALLGASSADRSTIPVLLGVMLTLFLLGMGLWRIKS